MIEFGDFYQHIAKAPQPLAGHSACAAQRLATRIAARQIQTVVQLGRTFADADPTRLDLLHGVRAEMEPALSPGQLEGIEKCCAP